MGAPAAFIKRGRALYGPTTPPVVNGMTMVFDTNGFASGWVNFATLADFNAHKSSGDHDARYSQLGHTHTVAEITDFTTSVDARIQNIVGAAPAALDTLDELAAALGDDANFAATVTTSLANKAPLVHTHVIGDTTGLQAALDAKAASVHTHDDRYYTEAEVDAALATKAATVHTHAIADTTGLQGALDAKAPLASPTFTGTPAAPTAAPGTNTTQLATTEFVAAATTGMVLTSNANTFTALQTFSAGVTVSGGTFTASTGITFVGGVTLTRENPGAGSIQTLRSTLPLQVLAGGPVISNVSTTGISLIRGDGVTAADLRSAGWSSYATTTGTGATSTMVATFTTAWSTSDHATRKGRVLFYVADATASREMWRAESDGSTGNMSIGGAVDHSYKLKVYGNVTASKVVHTSSVPTPVAHAYAVGDATSKSIDWSAGNVHLLASRTGNTVVAFTNASEGQVLRLYHEQDATGGRTLTFADTVKWTNTGTTTPPTIPTAASKTTSFTFERMPNGLGYRGTYLGEA
jgi:hypothetical protein